MSAQDYQIIVHSIFNTCKHFIFTRNVDFMLLFKKKKYAKIHQKCLYNFVS